MPSTINSDCPNEQSAPMSIDVEHCTNALLVNTVRSPIVTRPSPLISQVNPRRNCTYSPIVSVPQSGMNRVKRGPSQAEGAIVTRACRWVASTYSLRRRES